jgi:hypothetical protein
MGQPRIKARVAFCSQVAREFGHSRSHIWQVVVGQRSSPERERIIARQAELQAAAAEPAAAAQPAGPDFLAAQRPVGFRKKIAVGSTAPENATSGQKTPKLKTVVLQGSNLEATK